MLLESNFLENDKVKLYTEFLKSKNYNTNKVCILVSGAGAPQRAFLMVSKGVMRKG